MIGNFMNIEATELTHTEFARADAKSVWQIWSNCSTWSEWDHGVESCELKEGSKFELNGEAYLLPKGSPSPITIRFIECSQDKSFTDEGHFELGLIQFSHRVLPHNGGVEITHSLKYVPIDNKAKNIFEAHMLPKIRNELPESVRTLAKLVEEKCVAAKAT